MPSFTGDLTLNIASAPGGTMAIASAPTVVGTVSNSVGNPGTINGVGTLFAQQFSVGDTITVGAETQTVIRVTSDILMETTPFSSTFSGSTYSFAATPPLRFVVHDSGVIEGSQTSLTAFNMFPQVTVNNGATNMIPAAIIRAAPRLTYTGTGSSQVNGIQSDVFLSRTGASAPTGVRGAAVFGSYTVDQTNTQNWPVNAAVSIPSGVYGRTLVQGGASGNLAYLAGVVAEAHTALGSGTVDKLFGYAMLGVTGASGKLNNGVGAAVYAVTGDNRAYVMLSGTQLSVPSGNWAIYDETGYDTRLSGALQVGSDVVIDANAILHQYGVALPKNNDTAAAAPTANDDSTADYSVGSVWFWPATGRVWKLRDATAGAAEWVELALADEQGYIAGNWYIAPGITVAAGATPPADAMQMVPLTIKARVTLASLGVRIVTAEHGGNLQLALYANDPATGRPTGTAVATTAGISTASTGPVSAAIAGGNVTLEPGLYWACFNLDSVAGDMVAVQVPSPDNHPTAALVGSATQANLGGSAGDDLVSLYVAQAYGSWPDLTSATFVEGSDPVRNGPALHFQVA